MKKILINLCLVMLGIDYILLGYNKIAIVLLSSACVFLLIENFNDLKFKHLLIYFIYTFISWIFVEKAGINFNQSNLFIIILISLNIIQFWIYLSKQNLKLIQSCQIVFNSLSIISLFFIFIALIFPEAAINLDVYKLGRISMVSLIVYIFLPFISLYFVVYGAKAINKVLKYISV